MTSQRLYRSRSDRMLAGMCGGLAQYFAIDATLVRLFFVLAAVFSGGLFVLAYLILWVVVPEETVEMGATASSTASFGAASSSEASASGETPPVSSAGGSSPFGGYRYSSEDYHQRRSQWIGWALLGLGLLILVSNLHILSFLDLKVTWPIFLILGGMYLLMRQRHQI